MPGMGEYVILLVLILGMFPLWVFAMIDCATKEPPTGDRTAWLIVVALGGIIGAAAYLLVRRPKRKAQFGR
jgi:LPXTG-motif cell wall-anchored protein